MCVGFKNKKPRYLAELDILKRVELFQQYHLPGLSEAMS